MLDHVINLHEEGIHPPCHGLPYQWEETASPSEASVHFGHWETVHISLDSLAFHSKHGARQILNSLALQEPDGLLPGHLTIADSTIKWTTKSTYPPLWPIAINEYLLQNPTLMQQCYNSLVKQINWFESERLAESGGYLYLDYLDHFWESGIEEGVRYNIEVEIPESSACIDATSHVYSMYKHATVWGELLGKDVSLWKSKTTDLERFIQNNLYNEQSGFFFDQWAVNEPKYQKITFEGMWPLVVGAITKEQAERIINDYLISPHHFLTEHPVPSVSISDPHFELSHWRGATYNSLTYWAARGCLLYGRPDAANMLLERSLDATADIYQKTGSIWECYHPQKGDVQGIRHPITGSPRKNHLGHNPLIALSKTYQPT